MKRSLRTVLLTSAIVPGLFCLVTLSYVGATLPKTGLGTGPREVPPREVRLRFRQVTDRKLPKGAANLRAITGGGRAGKIFVRFEADRQGQEEVVALFTDQGAVFRSLDPGELVALKQSTSVFFDEAKGWQDELRIDLYTPASIRSARVWEGALKMPPPGPGRTGYDVLYQVLIDPHSGVVYIFAETGLAY